MTERLLTSPAADTQIGEGVRRLPAELLHLADGLRGVSSGLVLFYCLHNFGKTVDGRAIYEQGLGHPLEYDWHNHLWVLIHRTRKILPLDFALYGLIGTGRYLLDYRRDEPLLPDFREPIVAASHPQVQPLLTSINLVDPNGDLLRSRLSPVELSVVNTIGLTYPKGLTTHELIPLIRRDTNKSHLTRYGLWVAISRARERIDEMGGGMVELAYLGDEYRFVFRGDSSSYDHTALKRGIV